MKAPAQASDISKEWIQYMLTEYESKERPGTTVTVDSFETDQGNEVGKGYAGYIVILQVNAALLNKSESNISEIKQYDLVIKLKGTDQQWASVMEKLQMYLKEVLIYSKVLVEFDNFQKSLTNNRYPIKTPKFIYGKCTQDEFVLVMENIKGKGFSVHNIKKFFNFEQLKSAVTQLVRLHAVSYSYNQYHSFLEKHPECKQTDYGAFHLRSGSSALIDVQIEVIKNEKDKEELLHKIESNKDNLLKQCQEIHNHTNYKVVCLVHGDAHSNNMMFKYNDCDANCDNPNDIKLFDWPYAHWHTPVLDLQFLIYLSTSSEFRKEYLEDILKFYHITFMEATSNMGIKAIDWSYEDFKKEFNYMGLYGINKGILAAFLLQSSKEEKQKSIIQSIIAKILTIFSTPIVKVYQYFFSCSDLEFQMNNFVKAMVLPHIKEITTRNNTNLASRVLGLINEAEENGLYG